MKCVYIYKINQINHPKFSFRHSTSIIKVYVYMLQLCQFEMWKLDQLEII